MTEKQVKTIGSRPRRTHDIPTPKEWQEIADTFQTCKELFQEASELKHTIQAQQQELFELKYGKYCRDYYVGKVQYYMVENLKQSKQIQHLQEQMEKAREVTGLTKHLTESWTVDQKENPAAKLFIGWIDEALSFLKAGDI